MKRFRRRIQLLTASIVTAVFITGFTITSDGPGSKNITKPDMMKHITYLASDELQGRFPGTAGDDLTQEYIIEEFKKYKIKPGGDKGYVQEFDMYTHVELAGKNGLSIGYSGTATDYAIEKDFQPLGYSSSGSVSGGLAFVGYGISTPDGKYNDYADKDGNPLNVRGKILLVMRFSPGGSDPHSNPFDQFESGRIKAMKAKEMGAAGVIFFNGPDTGEEDKLIKMTFDNVLHDAGIPVVSCKREIVSKLLSANGYDLKSIQDKINESKIPDSFEIPDGNASIEVNVKAVKVVTDNVIGFLEGKDPLLKNEVVVIGAHKDHLGYGMYGSLYGGSDKQIHNGADDNASGTAGMLEIAQKLSANRKDLRRSYLFMAFGGEEAGLLGSAYFTKSPLFERRKIIAMLNMDMIGRLSDNKLIIYGTGSSPYWKPALDSLNSAYNFKLTFSEESSGRSDHASFYSKDVPVLHFFTGTHKDYHAPSDDVALINGDGAAKVASYVYDVAVALNTLSSKPEFTKIIATSNEGRSMGSVKVYVGTIPDYSYSGTGMKISGVKEGSPAEKGGLKAEDVILKFGEVEVNDIYSYMFAMSGYKPGDEVEIIVKRNEENVPLKVQLGSR
ncbi:MAG: M28 family peptidase [Ignavibacteria bacterium]|nr:M28 family peptidase [Ignavibacteria bacterium]